MSRQLDLVVDSKLNTEFCGPIIVHSYLEINDTGGRFSREEHWSSQRILGRGGFGQVRLERCVTEGPNQGSLRAVKIITKPLHVSGTLGVNRELEAIAKFSNHRYKRWFVKSFGWFEDPDAIFIAMEYCRHGDLHHYLRDKQPLPVEEVQQLTCQMLEGLQCMHENDFAHRDLKPGNILIKSMPPEEDWWIVAPELLGFLDQAKPKSVTDFKAADMWALGEIVFQMLTGETSFQNPVVLLMYCLGQQEFPSDRLPTPAGLYGKSFTWDLMKAQPIKRMTAAQGLAHEWMQSMGSKQGLATPSMTLSDHQVKKVVSQNNSATWSNLSSQLEEVISQNDSTTWSNLSGQPSSHVSIPLGHDLMEQIKRLSQGKSQSFPASARQLQGSIQQRVPVHPSAYTPVHDRPFQHARAFLVTGDVASDPQDGDPCISIARLDQMVAGEWRGLRGSTTVGRSLESWLDTDHSPEVNAYWEKAHVYMYCPPCYQYLETAMNTKGSLRPPRWDLVVRFDERLATDKCSLQDNLAKMKNLFEALSDYASDWNGRRTTDRRQKDFQGMTGACDLAWLKGRISTMETGLEAPDEPPFSMETYFRFHEQEPKCAGIFVYSSPSTCNTLMNTPPLVPMRNPARAGDVYRLEKVKAFTPFGSAPEDIVQWRPTFVSSLG